MKGSHAALFLLIAQAAHAQSTESADAAPTPLFRFEDVQVRDEGLPKLAATAGPAQIGWTREQGREASLIKAAVIANSRTLSSGGSWYSFVSLAVNRNLAAAKSSDTRSINLGLSGPIGDYVKSGVALDSRVAIGGKRDGRANTSSGQAVFENNWVIDGLATGQPWPQNFTTFQLVPYSSVGIEDIISPGITEKKGTARFAYGGFSLALWPHFIGPRVQLNVVGQRLTDRSTTGERAKRYLNYGKVSLDFYLYDPLTKPKFNPIFGIERETGSNPVNAVMSSDRTSVTFRFKVN